MILQYIQQVQGTETVLNFSDRQLWSRFESKEYALNKGYRQLRFSCERCSISEQKVIACTHYDRTLVFIPSGQPNDQTAFLLPIIDPNANLKFELETIPRCSVNFEKSAYHCDKTSDQYDCHEYCSTLILNMPFIPMRLIHRDLQMLLPDDTILYDAGPFLGEREDRHAYRRSDFDHNGSNRFTLAERIDFDDELSDGKAIRRLIRQEFYHVSRKGWTNRAYVMDARLEAELIGLSATEYAPLVEALGSLTIDPSLRRSIRDWLRRRELKEQPNDTIPKDVEAMELETGDVDGTRDDEPCNSELSFIRLLQQL